MYLFFFFFEAWDRNQYFLITHCSLSVREIPTHNIEYCQYINTDTVFSETYTYMCVCMTSQHLLAFTNNKESSLIFCTSYMCIYTYISNVLYMYYYRNKPSSLKGWNKCHCLNLFSFFHAYVQGTKLWIIMEYLGGGSALDLVSMHVEDYI